MGKLVRDRIPEIIRREGKTPEVERISGERLRRALKDKLVEEAEELRKAEAGQIIEELADVQEVLDALIEAHGLDPAEIELVRADKQAKRGGFSEGLYLIR